MRGKLGTLKTISKKRDTGVRGNRNQGKENLEIQKTPKHSKLVHLEI